MSKKTQTVNEESTSHGKSINDLVADIYALLSSEKAPVVGASETPVSLSEKVLSSVRPRDPSRRKENVLYASEIGNTCDRAIWYNVREEYVRKSEPLLPHTRFKFLYGDLIEESLLTLARYSGHEVVRQQETVEEEIQGTPWKVRGRIDAVIDGYVVDVKSASTYAFKKFKEGTLPRDDTFGYMAQLGWYCRNLKLPGAFLAAEKQNGHISLYTPTGWDLEIATPSYTRLQSLASLLEESVPPSRAFLPIQEGKSGNLKLTTKCSYCPHKQTCWNDANDGVGIRTFLYSGKPIDLVKIVKMPKVTELTTA